jgi:hypothetical protein
MAEDEDEDEDDASFISVAGTGSVPSPHAMVDSIANCVVEGDGMVLSRRGGHNVEFPSFSHASVAVWTDSTHSTFQGNSLVPDTLSRARVVLSE